MATVNRILLIIILTFTGFANPVQAGHGKEIRGILITTALDTLHGFIKKIPEKKSITQLKFRSHSDVEFVELLPEQVEAFISEEEYILSHKIRLNNVERYVFIRRVFDGSLDLFITRIDQHSGLVNDGQDLYFAGFSDGRIIQMKKKYLIRTLQAIFIDCTLTLQKIKPEKFDYYYYKNRKLIALFTNYSNCNHQALALKSNESDNRTVRP